ncbi:MAG: phosphatidate cytidylyltransferase [Planctomycetota bacterium]|jgi:phosphatidate cytidylyltransferase
MLKHRLITGPLLVAALLAIVWFDDRLDSWELSGFLQQLFLQKAHPPRGLALFCLALVVGVLAARELNALFRADGIATRLWLTVLATETGLVLSYSIPTQTTVTAGTSTTTTIAIISSGFLVVFVLALVTFSRHRNVEGVVAAAGAVVFAMVYLGLMLGFLLALRRSHSAWLIVGVILTTKSCDTGAYFTGRLLGRHRMIPWLSPGKTWEGLAGGVATAILVGMILAALSRRFLEIPDQVPWWIGALGGLLFGVFGQLGDLAMSLLKRGAGVKDSSKILPGLGGVLDVLDSPLMVAPVAYWLLTLALSGS